MAIKVYSGVDQLVKPQYEVGTDYEMHMRMEDLYERQVIAYAQSVSKHKLAGEIVKFPVADGYARYVVIKPTELIHLDTGDAWHYRPIARLLGKDIVEAISRDKALDKLFG